MRTFIIISILVCASEIDAQANFTFVSDEEKVRVFETAGVMSKPICEILCVPRLPRTIEFRNRAAITLRPLPSQETPLRKPLRALRRRLP